MDTSNKRYRPASSDAMETFLLRALPGASAALVQLRAQLLEFACDHMATNLLLQGALGTGKTVIARLAALLKWIAPMSVAQADEVLSRVTIGAFGRIEKLHMPWFVELALTGLVEELAAAQLFGTVQGAFTGAIDRPGVFERAMSAHSARNPPPGAIVTRGIVFLDEVGDLSARLQPTLLPVLSGGTFYRVGAEGQEKYAQTFEGISICATWRDLNEKEFRPDLLSRISGRVIQVPGISERMADFELIIDEMQAWVMNDASSCAERMRKLDTGSVDRASLDAWTASIRPIAPDARTTLAKVDWSRHGNLRGLLRAVEATMTGFRSVDQVVAGLPRIGPVEDGPEDPGHTMLYGLMTHSNASGGLLARVSDVEHEYRVALQTLLKRDTKALSKLATKMDITEQALKQQVHELSRRRKS